MSNINPVSGHDPIKDSIDSAPDDFLDEQILLLHAEELSIAKESVITGHQHIQIKTTSERQAVEIPLTHKKVKVEVTPVNDYVEGIPEITKEANITLIPVYEERVVMVKKVFLKEMIKITEEISQELYTDEIEIKKQQSNVFFTETNTQK